MSLTYGPCVNAGCLCTGLPFFYVPNLNCNLISVANLCNDLNCTVTFSYEYCVLQDGTSRTLIGIGEQRDGVYFYKEAYWW